MLAVDGSQEVPLVQHPAHDSDPVWSADGTHVLFRSNRTRTSSLWAMPVKSGRPAGDAVLVKDDVPMGVQLGPQLPATMTRSGALYYTVSQGASERLPRGARQRWQGRRRATDCDQSRRQQ